MFQVLYGGIADGRVRGLGYLGYWVLLSLGLLGAIAVIGLVFSGIGQVDGAAPGPAGAMPAGSSQQSLPTMALSAALVAAYAFAWANLTAKRIRDIGLPGWPGVGILLVLGTLAAAIFAGPGAAGVQFVASLALILIPSDAFRRTPSAPPGA